MKQIWAPWRLEYILGDKANECIFCPTLKEKHSKQKLILFNGNHSIVMLNRYPYTNCHLLVAPKKHTDTFDNLTDEDSLDLIVTLRKSISILKEATTPDGFNLGMNLGRIAGAGVEDHIHFHIVSRWSGDTNFMPILAESSVIPEHLEKTYERLLPFFKKL